MPKVKKVKFGKKERWAKPDFVEREEQGIVRTVFSTVMSAVNPMTWYHTIAGGPRFDIGTLRNDTVEIRQNAKGQIVGRSAK